MNATKLEIRKLTDWDGLFCHYPRQTNPQTCYVELDCKTGILHASYNCEIGNAVPYSVYHGHDRRYGIPCLTADAANELLDEIAPLAQRVLDGYDSHLDGNNLVATLTPDAEAAEAEIERITEALCPDESTCVSGVDAGDWLTDAPDELTAQTTDEQIDAMAADLDAEAAAEHMVLLGTAERLTEQRQTLRDEVE